MNKKVTLIKLGGAIITDKSIPNTVRPEILTSLTKTVYDFWKENNSLIVLGHGAGSFAHIPASRYKVMDGFQDSESRLGMAITQDSAAQLNRIVVSELLKLGAPAVSVAPSSSLVTSSRKAKHAFDKVFREYLKQGLLPVTYGDVIVDEKQGCTIWSTDTILAFFAQEFLNHDWPVSKIIHVTQAEGVYKDVNAPEKGMFEIITPENLAEVKKSMGVVKGFDVTGGMWLKIEEAMNLTKQGVETIILSGQTPDQLQACLNNQPFIGTVIRERK